MTLDKIKSYIADLVAASIPREKVIEKARAMINGETIVDVDGNEVEVELVDLVTAAPPAEEASAAEEPGKNDGEATAKSAKTTVLTILDEMRKPPQPVAIPHPEQSRPTVPAEAIVEKSRVFSGPNASERAYKFGRWLHATIAGNDRSVQFCKDHGIPIIKVMGEGTNTAGGFLVPSIFESELIVLREQYGVFRRNAKIRRMTSDTLLIPRSVTEVTAYSVAENAEVTASDRAYDNVQLTARKIAALTRISSELAEDAMINVADDVAQSIAFAFAKLEDDCGFNGDGTSTYCGITGLKNKIGSAGITTQATGTAWSAIVLSDFNAAMGKLPFYAVANAAALRWYMSHQFYHSVARKLADAAGGATVMEIEERGVTYQFLGFPVEITQVMPTTTASGSIVAYFGNLSLAASFGDRRQTTVRTLQERWAEYDQIGILATQRFDIVVHDAGSSSVAGPIVALKTG